MTDTESTLNAVYRERAHLVALLAVQYPSTWTPDLEDHDFRIVYVDLPTGQASWHISGRDWDLLGHIPQGDQGVWDGHTTGEKYLRIRELTTDLHMRRVTQGDTATSETAG